MRIQHRERRDLLFPDFDLATATRSADVAAARAAFDIVLAAGAEARVRLRA